MIKKIIISLIGIIAAKLFIDLAAINLINLMIIKNRIHFKFWLTGYGTKDKVDLKHYYSTDSNVDPNGNVF